MSYYTSLGGASRRGGHATTRSAAAPTGLSPAAQAKAQEAERLSVCIERILALPQQQFADIQRAVAPAPPAIDQSAIQRAHRAMAVSGIRFWHRQARRDAVARADEAAAAEVAALHSEYAGGPAKWQAALDHSWEALCLNDHDVVLSTLAAAFEDNEAPAAAIGVEGAEVSLVVVVPPVAEAVPDRKPTVTAAGNLSLKKLTKAETSDLYKLVVCGHVLATVKECFAVAPGAQSAQVMAVRRGAPDAYGRSAPEVVLATAIERHRMRGLQWGSSDAATILSDCHSELHWKLKGAAKELQPLDITRYPDLQEALRVITFEDVGA